MSIKETPKQRALVLQGGGALGAYEVGVFNVLYHWIKKDCKDDENIFDIIAGTSIGAINAAIITNHTVEKRKNNPNLCIRDSWEGVINSLLSFWRKTSFISFVDVIPFYKETWNIWKSLTKNSLDNMLHIANSFKYINPFFGPINNWYKYFKDYYDLPATGEAARRFYSVKQIFLTGSNNLFLPLPPKLDTKFLYNPLWLSNNIWYKYNNQGLHNTLKSHINFPIATSFYSEDGNTHEKETNKQLIKQPRLLVITVDVKAGATVSFDSYEYSGTECKICNKDDAYNKQLHTHNSLQDHIKKRHLDNLEHNIEDIDTTKYLSGQLRWSVYEDHDDYYITDKEKHVIFYNEGIQSEHIMASANIPVHYDYQRINSYKSENGGKLYEEERHFWDGQLLSNTPLRELISEYKKYWQDNIGEQILSKSIINIDRQEDQKEIDKSEIN